MIKRTWIEKFPAPLNFSLNVSYSCVPFRLSTSAAQNVDFSKQQCWNTFSLDAHFECQPALPVGQDFYSRQVEQDCGWNYRYLSTPVNLCCHSGQLPPPGKKQSKGLPYCWGTASTTGSWDSLKQWLSQREKGANEGRTVFIQIWFVWKNQHESLKNIDLTWVWW